MKNKTVISLIFMLIIGIAIFYIIKLQSPINIPCSEKWSCNTWTSCIGNMQTRTCIDSNNCGTSTYRPALSQACTVNGIECHPASGVYTNSAAYIVYNNTSYFQKTISTVLSTTIGTNIIGYCEDDSIVFTRNGYKNNIYVQYSNTNSAIFSNT
jgi:hypothetical protein